MLLPHLVSTQSLQVCTVQWVPTVIPWYFGSFNPVYQTFTEHLFSIRHHDAGSREMRTWTQSMPTEVRREAWTVSLGFKLNLTSSKQVGSDWVPIHLQCYLCGFGQISSPLGASISSSINGAHLSPDILYFCWSSCVLESAVSSVGKASAKDGNGTSKSGLKKSEVTVANSHSWRSMYAGGCFFEYHGSVSPLRYPHFMRHIAKKFSP